MSTNLYGYHGPIMEAGLFWRCRHGHAAFEGDPCGRCGIWHPVKFAKHVWRKIR